jgi:hypothetical protein
MWPVSQRFLNTLLHSHVVRQRADILVDGTVAVSIDGIATFDPVTGARTASVGGSVSVQRALVRRSCEVDLLDLDGYLTPNQAEDLLAPLRNEVRLWRGVQYYDATPAEIAAGTDYELCPIGTFIINKIGGQYPHKIVGGQDRLFDTRGRFKTQWTVPAGQPTMSEAARLLQSLIPAQRLDLNLPDLHNTTALVTVDEEGDPAELLLDLFSSTGYVLYADPMGQITAQTEPTVDNSNIVWSFIPGYTNIARRPSNEIDATETYNAVVVKGISSDGVTIPPRGYSQDDNPASFTFVGKVGAQTYFYASPQIKSVTQANIAAETIRNRELGVADSKVISAVPNSALELGDLFYAEDSQQGIADVLIADAFNVPLSAAGEQQIDARAQVL